MFVRDFGPEILLPLLVFAIPIVAIVGGITAGIVRTIGQQRLIELAQRERIAAIERGVDPSKLPPLPVGRGSDDLSTMYLPEREAAKRRSQGLMVGGIVTLAVGISLAAMLGLLDDGGDNSWAVGLIPAAVGVALLVSAWLIHPRGNGNAGAPRT